LGDKKLADFEDLIQVINEKTKNMSEQQKNKFFVFINKCLDDMLTKQPLENNQVNTEKSKESINNDI